VTLTFYIDQPDSLIVQLCITCMVHAGDVHTVTLGLIHV